MSVDNTRLKFVFTLFALAAAVAGSTMAVAQVRQDTNLPITLDADNSSLYIGENKSVHTRLRITQGATRIEADYAETDAQANFADTRWRFRGNVRIDVDTASIRAESADLYFNKNRLVNATVNGKPATFRNKDRESGEVTRGQAESLFYDLDSELVRFEANANIANSSSEISGNILVYDVAAQKIDFEGDSNAGDRVQIVIQPPADEAEQTLREAAQEQGLTERLPDEETEDTPQP
ncbi:MAG: lipopolysaccharide transport periplasmic protein LptA [Pseudomonadota bacterium]